MRVNDPQDKAPELSASHLRTAAEELLRRQAAGDDLEPLWKAPFWEDEMPPPQELADDEPLPPPPVTGWEEATILATRLAADSARLVEKVRRVNPILASRCLEDGELAVPEKLV
jgi:hypothetical protein